MDDWMKEIQAREEKLPKDIQVVWKQFRNTFGGEEPRSHAWSNLSRELWCTLPASCQKRKAINRIYQILQSRQHKAQRLSRSGNDEAWEEYLCTLLNDLIDILEEAWGS